MHTIHWVWLKRLNQFILRYSSYKYYVDIIGGYTNSIQKNNIEFTIMHARCISSSCVYAIIILLCMHA